MTQPPEPIRPFRWDLTGAMQLGSLLDDAEPADLWFADELVECAAKVLARSADGDLFFVGRSMDSMYDLLSGALRHTGHSGRPALLPMSLSDTYRQPPSIRAVRQMRANLAADGLAPHDLARRRRPVVFVDLVAYGGTFGGLYELLRRWIAEEGAQWDVIRRRLRFIGITHRKRSSPSTWRWQQHHDWPAELPARAIVNVSLPLDVWRYLGNDQPKTSGSHRPHRWLDEGVRQPPRDTHRLRALAEAVALVEHGAQKTTRGALVRHVAGQPTISEPWLRSLVHELRR